jgi:MFS family permease
MATSSAPAGLQPQPAGSGRRGRRTELDTYPSTGRRYLCLGIVVLATIVLYYQFYLAGAVAAGTGGKNGILVDYGMSFKYYVYIAVVGYILGAVASFATGFADRYGRVNIVTVGLAVVALLCLFGIPLADSKAGFAVVFAAIGLVEGVILVATPALIRDFSPQLGRASAMGFWTLGPVLGSLVVSIQISNTSNSTPWHNQYAASGIVGLVVAALSLLFLRELAPELRDQVMVSSRDRALVEARAKGIDIESTTRHPFRQMLKPDIIGSAFAISVFLIIYYVAVGFFPVYFQTIFGFSQSKANALGNWNWTFNALALIVVGVISDMVRVRKPFMVIGAVGAIIFTSLFAIRATHPHTSYSTFVWLLIGISVSLGVAYAPWMASFTETVEKRNPALTATGLAVWGLVIRLVIAVSVFIVPHIVDTATTLVEKGATVQEIAGGKDPKLTAAQNDTVKAVAADPTIVPKVQGLAGKYAAELKTAAKLSPATKAALAQNPTDQATGIKAVSELSGVSPSDVATIAQLNAAHGPALEAAKAIDTATITTLLTDKTNTAALQKAVGQITSKLGISAAEAQTRLQDLASIPVNQLLLLQSSGQKVLDAQAALVALGKVPATDLGTLTKYAALSDPKVQADLKYLQANAPAVLKAAKDSPKQWRNYFWMAVGGEIVFIPLIFLLAGFWSPRRARQEEQEHEAMVERELAKLHA